MNSWYQSIFARLRNNLLITVTLCYIGGGIMAKYLFLQVSSLYTLLPVLLVASLLLLPFYGRTAALFLIMPIFIGIGLLHTGIDLHPPAEASHVYQLIDTRAKVTITGRMLKMPEYDGEKTRFNVAVDSLRFHTGQPGKALPQAASGKIRLTLEGELPGHIRPGDQIMALASVNRTSGFSTPGVFDYRLFLAEKGIHVTGRIKSPTDILSFKDLDASLPAKLPYLPERLRSHIANNLRDLLDPSTSGVYQALLIGSRAGISDATLEQFKASGTMHLLAISGIHMSLLGLITMALLTWIMRRSKWLLLNTHVPTVATLLSLLPLVAYALIAGLNTPVLRSLLMSSLFLIGVVLQRQRSIIFIIAAAALILLIFKPLALFTASFQLSFASILAIGAIYPHLRQQFTRAEVDNTGKIRPYITSAILISFVASLGTLPFMLYHFNRFSLVGPFVNLLVEPFLCFWSLPLGLIAIPLLFINPETAQLLLRLGEMGILAADRITHVAGSLPFSSVWTITPTIWEILSFYLLLYLWILYAGSFRLKILLGTLSLFLVVFFTHGLWFSLPASTAKFAFLDVGQGSASMIRFPQGRAMLIDCGSKTSTSFDIGERVIAPYLWKQRLWQLDDIILTHPDSDHVNGVNFLLKRFRPARLWINGDGKKTWPYSESLSLAAELGISVREPGTGHSEDVEQGSSFTFILGANQRPPAGTVNDRSLVIRVDHQDNSFLFPGDISTRMEKTLISEGAELEADLLLAPHHGSRGSGSEKFIRTVDPDIIVISAGQSYRRMYLDPGHLSSWKKQGRTVLTTVDEGTITCLSNGKNLAIETYRDRETAQYAIPR